MKKQAGFTLIELAIVLVIIGLLLGGVLKGQELINSAKVKNLASDFRNIPVYIYGYQDKFKALPGDDKSAAVHLGVAADSTKIGNGDGALGGNWYDVTSASEAYMLWQHVRLAGLATGATDMANTDWRPTNADGNPIGIMAGTNDATKAAVKDKDGNAIRGSYVICSKGILGKYVTQLDVTMDNGDATTGSMIAYEFSSTDGLGKSPPTSDPVIDPAKSYVVCYGV
ncbi:MAG: prepilin-type N-terminal cleavage/methylation domain-containing protein [Methylotenera sp.]|uniref:prepilin-type N-terminal cleavage/methylation domain-containing protein n=1 Tax=Methylotenera sp. TaxID=2051956 RepID=UPI0024874640|nr:prepilin-type N-terminal cleavage/methylation domain-containing protein [Methylotenera sp.]MDI1309168.1 prepilin-type N-terminal cleavage/methylation domain-containing protein [Methylotenera sp.]